VDADDVGGVLGCVLLINKCRAKNLNKIPPPPRQEGHDDTDANPGRAGGGPAFIINHRRTGERSEPEARVAHTRKPAHSHPAKQPSWCPRGSTWSRG
jgi:hypothetical protein